MPPRASRLKSNLDFIGKNVNQFSIENWSLINSGKIFDRDRDRYLQTKIADRFEKKIRDPILVAKSRIDFRTKIGSRFNTPSMLSLLNPVFNRGLISK